MRQKSLNETMNSRGKNKNKDMATDIMDIDDLLDDEGWDILNGLTEEELEQLNSDFDPENSLLPISDRGDPSGARLDNAAPMFKQEDLVDSLNKMVAKSKPVFKNEKIRKKEEIKQKEKQERLKKQYSRDKPEPPKEKEVALTEEEEALLNEATEEELIEAAENARLANQIDMREKILHALYDRKSQQRNMLSFVDHTAENARNNPNPSNPDNFDTIENKINDNIALQFDTESPYKNEHDQYMLFDYSNNIYDAESDSETDTITELPCEKLVSHNSVESYTSSSCPSDSQNELDSDIDIKVKKVDQIQACKLDRRKDRTKGKHDSKEYNIDHAYKNNKKGRNYDKNHDDFIRKSVDFTFEKSKRQESIERVLEYNHKMRNFLQGNEEMSSTASTCSLSSLSDFDGDDHVHPTDRILSLPTVGASGTDYEPPVKVDLNVILNRPHEGLIETLTYSNYSSNCNDKHIEKRGKMRRKSEIKIALDIEVSVDENNNVSSYSKSSKKELTTDHGEMNRPPVERIASVEQDDLVNQMINDIAKRRKKRNLEKMSSSDSFTMVDEQSKASVPNTNNTTKANGNLGLVRKISTPMADKPLNRFQKAQMSRESSVDITKTETEQNEELRQSLSNDTEKPNDTEKDINLLTPSNNSRAKKSKGKRFGRRDELFSDSGIDQTSSEMGFTTPIDYERESMITPVESELNYSANTLSFQDSKSSETSKNIFEKSSSDKTKRESSPSQENVVLRQNRGRKPRPNSGSFPRPRSGSWSRAKVNSSKLKLSRDKSFEQGKKQPGKLKNQKSIDIKTGKVVKKRTSSPTRQKSRSNVTDTHKTTSSETTKNDKLHNKSSHSKEKKHSKNDTVLQKSIESKKSSTYDQKHRNKEIENQSKPKKSRSKKPVNLKDSHEGEAIDHVDNALKEDYIIIDQEVPPEITSTKSSNLTKHEDMKNVSGIDNKNKNQKQSKDHSNNFKCEKSSKNSTNNSHSLKPIENTNGSVARKNSPNLLERLSNLNTQKNENENQSDSRVQEKVTNNKQMEEAKQKSRYKERKLSREKSIEKLKHFNDRLALKEKTHDKFQKQIFPERKSEEDASNLTKLLHKDKLSNLSKSNKYHELSSCDEEDDSSPESETETESTSSPAAAVKYKNADHRTDPKPVTQSSSNSCLPEKGSSPNLQKNNKYEADKTTNSSKNKTMNKDTKLNAGKLKSSFQETQKTENYSVTSNKQTSSFGEDSNKPTTAVPVVADLDEGSETNYFLERRKARQRRLNDDYIETQDYNAEEKLSAAQQIDLINLKMMKEKAAKEKAEAEEKQKAKEEEENQNKRGKLERTKSKSASCSPVMARKEIPPPKQNQKVKPHSLTTSPVSRRKSLPPPTNEKKEGLKALENIRANLRRIPKPPPKEESVDSDDETVKREESEAQTSSNDSAEQKPKRKSTLAALLERDNAKLGDKKKPLDENKVDTRGVTPALLQQALLKMNGILTNDQINSVFAGEKPAGASIKATTTVKATKIPPARIVRPSDEETELDVVALMKHLKEDSDSLFYVCINNQPKLERNILQEVFQAVENSKKIKHLSLAMTGLIDADVKKIARAIRYNEQLETLNLESNIITQSGLDALMKEVSRHPSLREIKISNQKQPFGGQGEAMMADAIDRNENILKFGYSFKQPGPRNKADRAIIRHNENLRQRRRNGENVYDLKAVCKTRDPWPQPWIITKGRRLLGGLLEAKVTEMGHMIDPDNDVRRESRGPKLRQEEAKPLDINSLLAARRNKLKGSKIADLEEEQERKNKRIMKEMHESTKPATEKKENKEELEKVNDTTQMNGHEEPQALKGDLDSGVNDESSPTSEEKPVEKEGTTKKPLGKGMKIASIQDDEPSGPRRRRKKSEDEQGGINFDAFEKPKEEPKKVEPEPKVEEKKKTLGQGIKIAPLENDEPKGPRRRRKKSEDEADGGINFDAFESKEEPKKAEPEPKKEEVKVEEKKEEKKEEEKKKKILGAGVKIAKLQNDEPAVPRRRRKKFDDDEGGGGLNFDEFEVPKEKEEEPKKEEEQVKEEPKEEPKPVTKDTKAAVEERKKKLTREGGAKIVADLSADDYAPVRRRKQKSYDEEEENSKEDEVPLTAAEEESRKQRLLKNAKGIKAELPDYGVRRRKTSSEQAEEDDDDPFANVSKKVTKLKSPDETRRRKKKIEEEEEIDPFKAAEERRIQEEKEKKEAEAREKKEKEEEEKRKLEEQQKKMADIEGRKKKLSLEGGKKVVAQFEPDNTMVRRRRRGKYEEEEPEPEFLKEEPQPEPKPKEEEKKEEKEKEIEKKEEKKKEEKKEEVKVEPPKPKFSRDGAKKIASLTPVEDTMPIRRRRKKYDEDEEEDFLGKNKKSTEEAKKKEEEEKKKKAEEEEEKKLKEKEEEKSKERVKKTSLPGAKKIAELPPAEEKVSLRRRKKEENESEKVDPFSLVEKTEMNAVRVASKNIKGLPPPETTVRRRRRKDDDEEEQADPFAAAANAKAEEKKKDEETKKLAKKVEEKKTEAVKKEPEKLSKSLIAERSKKIAALPPPDEGVTSIRRRRRRDDDEESVDPFASVSNSKKDESENKERWYTDEETKSGDRRQEKEETKEPEPKKEDDEIDIFAGRNDDGGPKLSLRERMARRGR